MLNVAHFMTREIAGKKFNASGHRSGETYPIGVMRFGDHCLHPFSRTLLYRGQAVPIGGRAFDLLMTLARSQGSVVSKADLLNKVWPDTFVDDCNLRFQIGVLRKALGPDRYRIKNISGRGYFFSLEDAVADERKISRPNMTPPSESDHVVMPEIVVIDPSSSDREGTSALLASLGFSVAAFDSAESFMADPGWRPPACFVLDVWLPGRTGLEFQADLLLRGVQTPVIFATDRADVTMAVSAMKAGALEFLLKPLRTTELIQAIRTAVRSLN